MFTASRMSFKLGSSERLGASAPSLNAAPSRGNGHKPVEMQSEASHGGGLMRYPKKLSKRADEILAARRQTAQERH